LVWFFYYIAQAPVSSIGELTPDGVKKLNELIGDVHKAFLGHVVRHRPGVDVKEVDKGKSWLGQDALLKGLVDDIMHSDEYIKGVIENKMALVYLVKRRPPAVKGKSLFSVLNPALSLEDMKATLLVMKKRFWGFITNLVQTLPDISSDGNF